MSNNKINHLPGGFFKGCLKITVLHVSRNRIKILPEALFADLEQLEDLDLSSNAIERLPKFLFSAGGNLKRLQLAENRIDYLPSGTSFCKLYYVLLYNNIFRCFCFINEPGTFEFKKESYILYSGKTILSSSKPENHASHL